MRHLSNLKMLSVVIVSYRCWSSLDLCLKSLEAQDLEDLEVIVVDNHSDDGMAAEFVAKHPSVQFILQHLNGGFAQACNRGALDASGDWILFLNPDTILPVGVLKALMTRVVSEPNWKLIGIKQYDQRGKDTYPHGLFLTWWNIWPPVRSLQRLFSGSSKSKKRWSNDPISYPDWISGSFVLMRKNDFKELGGWDERFWMYCEDMDLSKRASLMGWKRVMYNQVSCIHKHGGSSRIDAKTKAITKAEVIISTHRYINKYFTKVPAFFAHATLIKTKLIEVFLLWFFSPIKRSMLPILWKYWGNLIFGKSDNLI